MEYNNFIPIYLGRVGNRFRPSFAACLYCIVFPGHGKHTPVGLDQWDGWRWCGAGLCWFHGAPFRLYQKCQSHLVDGPLFRRWFPPMPDGSDKGKAPGNRRCQCKPFIVIGQSMKLFVVCLYALQVRDIALFTISGLDTTTVHDGFVGGHSDSL
jgi:hypothetical protein